MKKTLLLVGLVSVLGLSNSYAEVFEGSAQSQDMNVAYRMCCASVRTEAAGGIGSVSGPCEWGAVTLQSGVYTVNCTLTTDSVNTNSIATQNAKAKKVIKINALKK